MGEIFIRCISSKTFALLVLRDIIFKKNPRGPPLGQEAYEISKDFQQDFRFHHVEISGLKSPFCA